MQFRRQDVEPITCGDVTLSFRRWRRPQARVGAQYRVFGGSDAMIEVTAVEQISPDEISQTDAEASGATSPSDVLAQIAQSARRNADPTAPLYRIAFRYIGEQRDPRLSLGEDTELGESELTELRDRLAGMDRRSKRGAWTRPTLQAIAEQPGRRAPDLAEQQSVEVKRFKADVRKLKALGLTISLEVGYQLSPRGQAVLEKLDQS